MVHAKNYETTSTFVEVIERKLLASFFQSSFFHFFENFILIMYQLYTSYVIVIRTLGVLKQIIPCFLPNQVNMCLA